MDPAGRTAEALAVVDGRIAAVGPDAALRRWIGPRTRVIDLRGRTVTPGFGDAHVHPVTSGLDRLRCDLTGSRASTAYLDAIAVVRRVAPGRGVDPRQRLVDGRLPGWHRRSRRSRSDRARSARLPRELATGTRPGSTAVALARAGITATTPDPRDGRIERDADGTRDRARSRRVPRVPVVRTSCHRTRTRSSSRRSGSPRRSSTRSGSPTGRTRRSSPRPMSRTRRWPTAASSTARVVGALGWDETRGDEQIEELVERRAATARPRYAPTSVKFFADGILENFTGAVLEPYLDRDGLPTSNRGDSLIEPAVFGAAVARLDALGFQVHVHAIGDRAVRDALDAIEVARRANGPSDTRPQIAHLQLVHPDDIGRFRGARRRGRRPGRTGPCSRTRWSELTIPFVGSRTGRPDVSVRRRCCEPARRSRWGRTGASRRRTRCSRWRWRSSASATSTAAGGRRSCPTSGSTSTTRWRASPWARPGSTTSTARSDRSRSARRPTSWCSIVTCSIVAAGAIGEARVVATFIDGERGVRGPPG